MGNLIFTLVLLALSTSAEALPNTRCKEGRAPSLTKECGFAKLRTVAKAAPQCMKEIRNLICEHSMWADLNLNERLFKILDIGKRHAQHYKVDQRALACIAARESIYLDPLSIAYDSCASGNKAQGLGQVLLKTLKDMMTKKKNPFRSRLPPFDSPPYSENPELLFDAMAVNVELQLEIMSAVFKTKLDSAKQNYKNAFRRYNAHPTHQVEYSKSVHTCYACIQKEVSKFGDQKVSAKALNCLNMALPPKGAKKTRENLVKGFKHFRASCKKVKGASLLRATQCVRMS